MALMQRGSSIILGGTRERSRRCAPHERPGRYQRRLHQKTTWIPGEPPPGTVAKRQQAGRRVGLSGGRLSGGAGLGGAAPEPPGSSCQCDRYAWEAASDGKLADHLGRIERVVGAGAHERLSSCPTRSLSGSHWSPGRASSRTSPRQVFVRLAVSAGGRVQVRTTASHANVRSIRSSGKAAGCSCTSAPAATTRRVARQPGRRRRSAGGDGLRRPRPGGGGRAALATTDAVDSQRCSLMSPSSAKPTGQNFCP